MKPKKKYPRGAHPSPLPEELNESYLVVGPGLEELALAELRDTWALLGGLRPDVFGAPLNARKDAGGVTVFVEPGAAWILNHYLKIPTRILQRIARFPARDFPKLYNRLRKLPWHKYLRQGDVEVKAACTRSRLKIKERIQETALDAIEDANAHNGFRKSFLPVPQSVFLRVSEDIVTVSVDTSGETLYRRGYKTLSVEAPIRETLAAALIRAVHRSAEASPGAVWDPMCGSGTLVFEAVSFRKPIRSRSFAYQNFPSAAGQLKFEATIPLPDRFEPQGFGFDRDPKALLAARENGAAFAKKFEAPVLFEEPDSESDCIGSARRPVWMLVNPPYDERLSTERDEVVRALSEKIRRHRPEWIGLVWPESSPPRLDAPVRWVTRIATKNGGLPVVLAIGQTASTPSV